MSRQNFKIKWMPIISGILTLVLNWRWKLFVVHLQINFAAFFPEGRNVEWPSVVFFFQNQMFFYWMSRLTTLMQKLFTGLSVTFRPIREQSLLLPTTVTS